MSGETIEMAAEMKELLTIRHTVKKYGRDEYLFHEGDAVKGIYFVRSGNVQVGKLTPAGRELTLKICGENQLVAELMVFSGPSKYRLHAKALEETVCYKITVEDLEEALLCKPKLAATYLQWMGMDQQKTQTKFRDLLLHGKKGALYSTLIRLTNSYGLPKNEGILIDLVLTNQELANFCGMTREVVNRMLSELKKQGIVSQIEGKIFVHDLAYLKEEISCENCPIYLCKID